MRFNFRKISALASSALMLGMTAGVAAAANYPAPFSSGDVAIVYGSSAASTDSVQAANIQTDLGITVGGPVSISGEVVSIDTSSDRIWLNTSLNSVKDTITKSDLPTVLADYTFSGDVTSKVTSTIKLQAGGAAGGANSGKVIFVKQPSSSDDPVVGISLGTSVSSNPLYNASATMSAINFTHADSEGEEIMLFGQSFTIAADSDTTQIVLLKEAEKVDLTTSSPSATVTVEDSVYTLTLVTASATSATIRVTDSSGKSETKEINEAASKRVNGIDVAITRASASGLESVGESASVIAGSNKVTLQNSAVVTTGEDDDPVDGTFVTIVGGTGATTEIAISVFRPDSTNDAILSGESFVDPVFGSFKVDFAGLSSPLDDSERETISIETSGDDTMTILFTDSDGNSKVFDFAHNESGSFKLGDNSNFSIGTRESTNLSYAQDGTKYIVIGNEDYGHILELTDVYNQTTGSSSITNDRVKFKDVRSGDTYATTFTSTEGQGTIDVDGKRYTVTFTGSGESAGVRVKYPTSETSATQFVVYPTIKTKNGGLVSLYEPLTLNLSGMAGTHTPIGGLKFPDGDGYTTITVERENTTSNNWNFTGGGVTDEVLNLTSLGAASITDFVDITIGEVVYNFTGIGVNANTNQTVLYITNPEGSANIDNPGILLFEGKDDNTEYHAIFIDLEDDPAGTSTDGVGVGDVLFTQNGEYYHASATRSSDSDFTEDIDWYGTHITTDASDSDQHNVVINYPSNQVYAQVYIGETGASIAGTAGDILVTDSELSSVSSKNLIVVGGSCINSAAAALVGGAYCESDWTDATGVGSGQFLIQSFGTSSITSKVAVLVAGYNAADTANAATYLINQPGVNTDAGSKYIGTTSTSATLVVNP